MIITASKLKELGYKVSANLSAAEIDRAEADILAAYFSCLYNTIPNFDNSDDVEALASLVYLLLCRRKSTVTRYGTVDKKVSFSDNKEVDESLREQYATAAMWLKKIREKADNPKAFVYDICHIYFKTVFFHD